MIHYSCDRCKRELEPSELRYVMKLELQAVLEPAICNELECEDLEDFDDDFDSESLSMTPEAPVQHHYDLCPRCAKELRRNPLGRESHLRFGFSQN
jgi:hypothetical protein